MGNDSVKIRRSTVKGNKGSFTTKLDVGGRKLRRRTKKKRRLSNHAAK